MRKVFRIIEAANGAIGDDAGISPARAMAAGLRPRTSRVPQGRDISPRNHAKSLDAFQESPYKSLRSDIGKAPIKRCRQSAPVNRAVAHQGDAGRLMRK